MKIYLDLLPKQRKLELKREKIFREILREEFLFILPVILFIVILFNIYYLLSIQRDVSMATKSKTELQDKYQEIGAYEEKFKNVNESAKKIIKIQNGHLNWLIIFDKFSNLTPDGISISNLSTKDFNVFLVGKAKSRDILLDFKGKLENDSCFTDVNVPLSNLVVKNDIDFQMDLKVKRECLTKKL